MPELLPKFIQISTSNPSTSKLLKECKFHIPWPYGKYMNTKIGKSKISNFKSVREIFIIHVREILISKFAPPCAPCIVVIIPLLLRKGTIKQSGMSPVQGWCYVRDSNYINDPLIKLQGTIQTLYGFYICIKSSMEIFRYG